MAKLTPELETFILTRIDMLFYDINDFANSIKKQTAIMTSNGLVSTEIAKVLEADLKNNGPIFGKLKNDTKAKAIESINQSSRVGQMEEYKGDETFAWVTVSGHKVCMDCEGRTGMVLTYDQWEKEGMPGTGWSVCKGYCYCVLDPTGKVGDSVNVKDGTPEPGPKKDSKFNPYTQRKSKQFIDPELKKAAASEVAITDDVVAIRDQIGMKQHGLEYRLKDMDSALRKFMKENIEKQWTAQDIFTKDFKDLVRYTYILDDATYVDDYFAAIKEFEARGYKLTNVKNYWGKDGYMGLNTNLVAPDGRMFEVQFNTKIQQRIKDKFSHGLYEKIRQIGITESEKRRLEALMQSYWDECPIPKGFEEIKNYPK